MTKLTKLKAQYYKKLKKMVIKNLLNECGG